MNIFEFTKEVTDYINSNYEGYYASSVDTIKNNGVKYHGITINHGEDTVLPTIYLEQFLIEYLDGTEMPEIISKILEIDSSAREVNIPDMSFFTDFHRIKDALFLKIINTEKNEELLSQVPSRKFLDLSLVVYCDLSTFLEMNATVLVKNSHLESLGISKEELFNVATNNTRNMKILKKDIAEVIMSMEKNRGAVVDNQPDFHSAYDKIYVMTNKDMVFGAVTMIFDDVLDEFIMEKYSGVYIIPSSIHEVLLVPDLGNMDRDNLNSMIREVNLTSLLEQEILSFNAYYYSPKEGYSIV